MTGWRGVMLRHPRSFINTKGLFLLFFSKKLELSDKREHNEIITVGWRVLTVVLRQLHMSLERRGHGRFGRTKA